MKTPLKFLLLLCSFNTLFAQDDFITTWKTDNTGTSCDSCITIPTNPSLTYLYDVDWENDGTFDTLGVTGDISHAYDSAGTYQVAIRSTFPQIYFNDALDSEKLISVDQWGNIQWLDFQHAFMGCTNFNIIAADTPNLTAVENYYQAFDNCSNLNADINHWDVSAAKNMKKMFFKASMFNSNLNDWDVSLVEDMEAMFMYCQNFDGNIADWDVSRLKNANAMFALAATFNQDISNWSMDSVTSIMSMFHDATSFNQPIGKWNTTQLEIAQNALDGASSFDQDLGNWQLNSMLDATAMLDSTGIDLFNYDNTLKAWALQDSIPTGIILGVAGLKYCFSDSIRASLISDMSWTINGDVQLCDFPLSAEMMDSCYALPMVEISTSLGNTNEFVSFYDNVGNLAFMLHANGNDLGEVNADMFLSSTIRSEGKPYINRDISIYTTNQPLDYAEVRMFYTAAELDSLQAVDSLISLANIEFTKTTADCSGGVSGIRISVYPIESGTYPANGNIFVDLEVVSFSTFHMHGPGGILPAELLVLDLKKQSKQVELNWHANDVLDKDIFVIERANDDLVFQAIHEVPATDRTDEENYNAVDANPSNGANYYRICKIEANGTRYYSNIQSVQFDFVDALIYPNPSNDFIYFNRSLAETELRMYNLAGQLVMEQSLKGAPYIDVIDLPVGKYQLQFIAEGKLVQQAFIKH